jgi:LDH2 family malate/lactate/ureidoglycolate dehydrogenase
VTDPTSMQRFDATALAGWLADVFAGCGLDAEAAVTAARVLVRTSARGVDTHGVSRALVYAQKLRSAELTAKPDVVLEDRAGVLHCHADGGMGQVVATRAVEAAVERATHSGFVPVVMHEIGHLGALGMFALQAAESGMIAFVGQSAPPMMALPGARAAAIGNNPLAFASPVGDGPPLVFDIAASKVARGNVLAAARDGRAIPPDWAIDADGQPTTDPQAALKGAMLPMSGHKGIGLAMMVQCLAGSLSGAVPPALNGAAPGSAPARVGAFLFVANPALIAGTDAFRAHMGDWLQTYRRASGADGRYPGEGAARLEADRTRNGIPVSASVLAELRTLGDLTGSRFSLKPLA